MPYSTSDKSPIQHELFDKFLQLRETEEPLPQAAGEGSTDSIESSKSGSLRALTDLPKRDFMCNYPLKPAFSTDNLTFNFTHERSF